MNEIDFVEQIEARLGQLVAQDKAHPNASRFVEGVRQLFEDTRGTSVNPALMRIPGTEGDTLLHYASSMGYIRVMNIVLPKGDKNALNDRKESSLHAATMAGQTEAILLLLEKNVDVKRRDRKGHRASYYLPTTDLFADVREELLKREGPKTAAPAEGASIKQASTTPSETSSLDQSRTEPKLLPAKTETSRQVDPSPFKTEDFIGLMVKHNEEEPNERTFTEQLVALFKTKPADQVVQTAIPGRDGDKLLHYVSALGYIEAQELLIDKGANVNAHNDYGDRPLHRALINLQLGGSMTLLKRGALAGAEVANQDGKIPRVCFPKSHLHDGRYTALLAVIKDVEEWERQKKKYLINCARLQNGEINGHLKPLRPHPLEKWHKTADIQAHRTEVEFKPNLDDLLLGHNYGIDMVTKMPPREEDPPELAAALTSSPVAAEAKVVNEGPPEWRKRITAEDVKAINDMGISEKNPSPHRRR